VHDALFEFADGSSTWSDTSTDPMQPGDHRDLMANGPGDGTWTVPAGAATQTVNVRINTGSSTRPPIGEANTTNNELSVTVPVTAGPPDLRPVRVIVPATVSAGDRIQLGVEIENAGSGPTPSAVHDALFEFADGSSTWSDTSTDPMQPGEHRNLMANGPGDGTWTVPSGAATQTINVRINTGSSTRAQIPESDMTNNEMSVTVQVGGESNLVPPVDSTKERLLTWMGDRDTGILSNPIDPSLGGYLMICNFLPSLGGDINRYTNAANWLASNAVARGRLGGLGFYVTNYEDCRCPFAPWWDDAGWQRACNDVLSVAQTASGKGVQLLAIDNEPYQGWDPAWNTYTKHNDFWSSTGPTTSGHSESEVHAKARERGVQIGQTIVSGGIRQLMIYGQYFEDSYWGDVQRKLYNVTPEEFARDCGVDFYAGVLSVDGIEQVTFGDAVFYKGNLINGDSWDAAFMSDRDQCHGTAFPRHFGAYASKAAWSAMTWIDPGDPNLPYESTVFPPNEEEYRHTCGVIDATGSHMIYGHHFSDGQFDYGPYAPGLANAVAPTRGVPRAVTSRESEARPGTLRRLWAED
jgi:hypothetical protein